MIPSHPLRLNGVRQRLERWRRTRKHPRSPVPAPIWTDAVMLARQHGLYRTARALRLDYSALKHHVEATDRAAETNGRAGFVELAPGMPPVPDDCVIEVEGRETTLRLRLKGVGWADLAKLGRALVGLAS